jgi:arginine utilization protein RocB
MILLIVAQGYQICFLDSEKELDVREVCGNTVPSILKLNKEEKQENVLFFNRQIRPQPFLCAQSSVYNSLNIIPVDVTIQATDRVVKQAIKSPKLFFKALAINQRKMKQGYVTCI